MAIDRRRKNVAWSVAEDNGRVPTWERIGIAVLMDIRDELQVANAELKQMNRVWGCHNFQRIPQILDVIARDSRRRERLVRAKAARRRKATLAKRA